jgi:hypothetical protein
MSSDEEGGGGGGGASEPNQRAGNIEGALTAKGDGQILKGRMEAERVRKRERRLHEGDVRGALLVRSGGERIGGGGGRNYNIVLGCTDSWRKKPTIL